MEERRSTNLYFSCFLLCLRSFRSLNSNIKKLRHVLQEREDTSLNYLEVFLIISNNFFGLSLSILLYLGLSRAIWDYLGLIPFGQYGTFCDYQGLSWTIWNYLGLFGTILTNLGLVGSI